MKTFKNFWKERATELTKTEKEAICKMIDVEKQDNPWAICTATVGRDSPKYESCVLDVKAKLGKCKNMQKAVSFHKRAPSYGDLWEIQQFIEKLYREGKGIDEIVSMAERKFPDIDKGDIRATAENIIPEFPEDEETKAQKGRIDPKVGEKLNQFSRAVNGKLHDIYGRIIKIGNDVRAQLLVDGRVYDEVDGAWNDDEGGRDSAGMEAVSMVEDAARGAYDDKMGKSMQKRIEEGEEQATELTKTEKEAICKMIDVEKQDNPWAICTAAVGRDSPKYESCVLQVKRGFGKDALGPFPLTGEKMQKAVNLTEARKEVEQSFPFIKVIDRDSLRVRTDQGPVVVRREETYSGSWGSGMATYGEIQGDWRQVKAIYDDCQEAFRMLDRVMQKTRIEKQRTIGAKWKAEVRRLVKEANKQGIYNNDEVFEYVKEKLPVEAFETWEAAYSEIERLSHDFNMEKDMGIEGAGPVPKSLLAEQDLEGETKKTKSFKDFWKQTKTKGQLAYGVEGEVKLVAENNYGDFRTRAEVERNVRQAIDDTLDWVKDADDRAGLKAVNQNKIVDEICEENEIKKSISQTKLFKEYWKKVIGKIRKDHAERVGGLLKDFEDEIKDEEEGTEHYQDLAEKNPEHASEFNAMAQDEAGHKDKLEMMKSEEFEGVTVYDNGGKTEDRYTIITPQGNFGMSSDAQSPAGFNQYVGDVTEGSHLGRKVNPDSLPSDVKEAIRRRLK